MKRTTRLLLLALSVPAGLLACGPWFYPAPPKLSEFPERLPTKTIREILQETTPPSAEAGTASEMEVAVQALARELGTQPKEEALKQIEELLTKNRAHDYRVRYANALFDFRDLLTAGQATAAEVNAYAAWRVSVLAADDGFLRGEPKKTWLTGDEEYAVILKAWQDEVAAGKASFAQRVTEAPPALRPHWLVQAGAWYFRHKLWAPARELFRQAVQEAPQHPRAEAAKLMLARVAMAEWSERRKEMKAEEEQAVSDLASAAHEALDGYVEAYPEGRYVPDIAGWKAGMLREEERPEEAIAFLLTQMDDSTHPEVTRRAVREFEQCLSALEVEDPLFPTLSMEEVAQRPVAALALVYHYLDLPSRPNFAEFLNASEDTDARPDAQRLHRLLEIRRQGRAVLARLAEAVALHAESYAADGWKPRYLAVLAWAATQDGEHAQALALCQQAAAERALSDDLQFVYAVALQRSGDPRGALAAYRELRAKFPESHTAHEAAFRIPGLLQDQHEAGLAVVEWLRLRKALENFRVPTEEETTETAEDNAAAPPAVENTAATAENPEPKQPASYPVHLEAECWLWADTLLQFAPLEELERGLKVPALEEEIAQTLRTMLRRRHLAWENFAAAQKFAEPVPETPQEEREPDEDELIKGPRFPVEATSDAWVLKVRELAKLTAQAKTPAAPATKAARLFALAEAWSRARGELMLRSLEDGGLFRDEAERAPNLRLANGALLGLAPEAMAQELESRDELRHAYTYYLAAAQAVPGTALGGRAAEAANELLRRMAELSPWAQGRAFTTGGNEASRKLVELAAKAPGEAKARTLGWTFASSAERPWLPGEGRQEIEDALIEAFAGETPQGENAGPTPDLQAEFKDIIAGAGSTAPSALRQRLVELRQQYQRTQLNTPSDAAFMNTLDDLVLFLSEPGLTPVACQKYVALRTGDGLPDLKDADLQPYLDYLTFIGLVRERFPADAKEFDEYGTRPITERMAEFLAAFPRSRKREAAMARMAIATVREIRGRTMVQGTTGPEEAGLNGYWGLNRPRCLLLDTPRALEALEAYEREFPQGRYAAEMRLWRGALALDRREYALALSLLNATLDDAEHRDLHLDAAMNMADLCSRLVSEPACRTTLLPALAALPSAQERLWRFAHSRTFGSRLRPLEAALRARFTTGSTAGR